MSGKRQKTQYSLALEPMGWGEASVSGHQSYTRKLVMR